jgi:hypothetical protein
MTAMDNNHSPHGGQVKSGSGISISSAGRGKSIDSLSALNKRMNNLNLSYAGAGRDSSNVEGAV